MQLSPVFNRILSKEEISFIEAEYLYKKLPTSELIFLAHELRKKHHPNNKITWIIDRNVNITNICVSGCLFCSFHCKSASHKKAYITSIEAYKEKIEELFHLGGTQLLLQGGMHPELGLNYYVDLFKTLKKHFPALKLHALGPPEIYFLSKLEKKTVKNILKILIDAGLDSLPGAGAEILSDRVRKIVSPIKCTTKQWLSVMKIAHSMGLPTTATMMFGHIETTKERLGHIFKIRNLQKLKPAKSPGFTAFIPWAFQSAHSELIIKYPNIQKVQADEYLRTLAISRIILNNIENIQASWLTMGKETAKLALHAGANDLGSIMIEENVVASAGVHYTMTAEEMKQLISEAGFEPQLRDQQYNWL